MILLYLAVFGMFLSILIKLGSLVRAKHKIANNKFLLYLNDLEKLEKQSNIRHICNECDGHGFTLDDYSNASISDYKVYPCEYCMSTGYLNTELIGNYINKQVKGEA